MFKKSLTSIFLALALSTSFYIKAKKPKQVYDEVVSLGYACQVAWQLEQAGVRHLAYPFDWFHTSSDALISFIYNKGVNFLDVDKIAVLGPYPGDPSHLKVVDLVYGIVSYHDFYASPPMDNYQEVKVKYDRRITRLFDLLHSRKKILFVRQGSTRAQIEYLDQLLHTLYPQLSYTILAVNNSEEYLDDWRIVRIKNFYNPDDASSWPGNSTWWKEMISQFNVASPSQQRDFAERW